MYLYVNENIRIEPNECLKIGNIYSIIVAEKIQW